MVLQKEKFNWLDFLRKLALIAIPVALQNLLTTTGSMVDTFMIGTLGENSVGAVGLCAQFMSLMFSGTVGFLCGGILFFSQYWGAKDDKGISRSYGATFILVMGAGMIFTILALFFPELVMKAYTNKKNIQAIGIEYLKIVGFAYPLLCYSMVTSAVLRATERVRIPLIGSIVAVSVNIFMNWVLIFGHLGAPALGVRGAAFATVIANLANVLTILILARITHHRYIFTIREHYKWTKEWIKEFLQKSFPIICNELLIGIGFMIVNIVMGRQSEQTIAAWAVFKTIEGVAMSFFMGFTNAASILVGKCVGAGKLHKAYERAKRLVYLCSLTIFAALLVVLAVHKPLLTGMSLHGETYDICTKMLIIYLIAATIRSGNWIHNDTFRAGGDAKYGTVLEIIFMYIMVVPCVCLSGLVFHAPVLVVFALAFVDEPIRYILMERHLYSKKWIKPVTEQGRQALKEFV